MLQRAPRIPRKKTRTQNVRLHLRFAHYLVSHFYFDQTDMKEYYAAYERKLAQTLEASAAANAPSPANAGSAPNGSPPAIPIGLGHHDEDDEDEEFVEVDVGYQDANTGQKRGRMDDDVGG